MAYSVDHCWGRGVVPCWGRGVVLWGIEAHDSVNICHHEKMQDKQMAADSGKFIWGTGGCLQNKHLDVPM